MIKLPKCGVIARSKKQKEIIKALNPLLRLELYESDDLEVHYSDLNVRLGIPTAGAAAAAAHPWKASENGTAFISIGAGELIAANAGGGGPPYPIYWEEISYSGGDIEVTASAGYICISSVSTPPTELNMGSTGAGDSGVLAVHDGISVEFVTTMASASGDLAFPICKVALDAGVATVTKQILTHNPSPSVTWISAAP